VRKRSRTTASFSTVNPAAWRQMYQCVGPAAARPPPPQRRMGPVEQRFEPNAASTSSSEEPQQCNSRGPGAAQDFGASPARARHPTQPQPTLEHPLLAHAQRPRATPHPFECKAMVSNARTNGCEVRKWWANPHSLWRRAKSAIASDEW
jgi:hypothetical protein